MCELSAEEEFNDLLSLPGVQSLIRSQSRRHNMDYQELIQKTLEKHNENKESIRNLLPSQPDFQREGRQRQKIELEGSLALEEEKAESK